MTSTPPNSYQVRAFVTAVRWGDYLGASYAFAGIRREGALHNLACRIVLMSRQPASDWWFQDEVEELAIRRGWIPVEQLRGQLESLHTRRIVLDREELMLVRDIEASYQWTNLLPGPKEQSAIGWRAHHLHGHGENQSLFLTYEPAKRLDARMRAATKRPFSGWKNLAAFLGEGGEPLGLLDRFNTNLECFAPVYARIEPESSLRPSGALSITVRCIALSGCDAPQLSLALPGGAAPRSLDLHQDANTDTWRSAVALRMPAENAILTLMLGKEIADEVTLGLTQPAPTRLVATQPKVPPALSARQWPWTKIILTVIAGVAMLAALRTNVASLFHFYLSFRTPNVEIAWVDGTQRPPRIDQPIALDPDNVDAETKRVRLPLLIAIRNKESRPLRLSSVEISVGDTIELRSPSLVRLEPGRVVREHDGAILQPSSSFLPLSHPDTLILPIKTATMGWLLLSDTKMPFLLPWVVAARETSLIDTTTIPVDVSLFFEGRPKYSEEMRLSISPLLDPTWPRGRAVLKAQAADHKTFAELANGAGQDLARWKEPYPPTGDTIDYRRTVLKGSGYQAVTVNGVLRYVAVDTDSDSVLDFELFDVDGDGAPDYRAMTRGWPRRIVLWGPEVVRINKRVNHRALLYMAQRVNQMVR